MGRVDRGPKKEKEAAERSFSTTFTGFFPLLLLALLIEFKLTMPLFPLTSLL